MKNQQERREEMGAYTTMLVVGVVSLVLIGVLLKTLFNLFQHGQLSKMGKQSCLLFSRYWFLWSIIAFFIVMPDMSICTGEECPLRNTCYRYRANASTLMQYYFTEVPYNVEEDKCDFYYPLRQKQENNLNLE